MANLTVPAADDTFGPFEPPISYALFDFTLLFEQSIFSIGPAALLLLVSPLRIAQLSNRRRVVRSSPLATAKLTLLSTLLVIQCVALGLWTREDRRTQASVAAAGLDVLAALALAIMSYAEHVRSVRPSFIINTYLLITLPLNYAEVRSLWIRDGYTAVAITKTISSVIMTLLLAAEAAEKGSLLHEPYTNAAPETMSGSYSRSTFWWLNPLFLTGYRSILSNETLTAIDDALLTTNVYPRFQRAQANASARPRSRSLLRILTTTLAIPLVTAIIPRLFLIFFRFMQPLLIHRVSSFVASSASSYNTNQGWGLTGAFGLVYGGLAISSAVYYHQVYRTITMVRGSLTAAIFAKTLILPSNTADEAAAVTLMSTDVQRIGDALAQMHEVWASVIEVGIGVWLLSRQISYAVTGPIAVTCLSIFSTMAVSKRIGPAMGAWMGVVQTRIDISASILESMKEIKMLGLSQAMTTRLRSLRQHEISLSLVSRRLLALLITLANVSTALGPGIAFVIYVAGRTDHVPLDVPRAFSALSLIALVTRPVAMLINAFGPLMEALACFGRIEAYLAREEPTNRRYLPGETTITDLPNSLGSNEVQLQNMQLPRMRSWPNTMISLTQASFGWKAEDRAVVKDFTLQAAAGSTVFIVGPVGCGKTTLLRGILGETPVSMGTIDLQTAHIGYVAQTPWIQNATIRNNILGSCVYDREWYNAVVHACALESDINELLQGDGTEVSSAGHSLSGGQKLRLTLARAVYSRCALLLLDDCFSGVDPENEETIFARLLGPGALIRRNGTTVLMATHGVHRLSFANHIVALSSNGTIVEEGPYEALMEKGGYVAGLNASRRPNVENAAAAAVPATLKEVAEQQRSQEASGEALARSVGDLRVYKYYFSAAGWMNAAAFAVFIMAFAVFSLFGEFWMVFWTSAVEKHGNSVNGTYLAIFVLFGILTIVAVFGVAVQVFNFMVPTSAKNLHEGLLKTVMAAPLYYFTTTHTGQTLNRFSQDLSLVDSELPMSLIQVCGPLCVAVIQAVFICISAAYFVTLLPAVVVVLYILQRYYLRTSRQIRLLDIEAKAPLFSHFLETIQGIVTIRAFGSQDAFMDEFTARLDKSQKPFYLMFCIQRWLSVVLDLIVAALAVLLMVMVVKLREKLDPGFVALALLNIMSFNNNLTAIIQMWTGLETSMGAIARLKTFNQSTPSERTVSEKSSGGANWPDAGQVTFKDFAAAYSLDSPDVLRNISLTISPGSKVAICGVSGSGKTSLIGSLFRLLETTNGSIEIDGVDIATLPRETVRSRINAIPQHTFLLKNASLRENVDPVEQACDAEIESALRQVHLWDTLTAGAPEGLSSIVEMETLLSHGQKQLFCLARALVRKSSVVVLDEATASVDVKTDELMQRVIREGFAHKTVVAVAHRLKTIADFDQVVVMREGRIVEVGQPQKLLAEEGGAFRALWET